MVLARQETEAEAEVETGDVQPAQARSLMKGDAVAIVRIEAAAVDAMLQLLVPLVPERSPKRSWKENSARKRKKPADVGPNHKPRLTHSLTL
jgi:hypothetical protein